MPKDNQIVRYPEFSSPFAFADIELYKGKHSNVVSLLHILFAKDAGNGYSMDCILCDGFPCLHGKPLPSPTLHTLKINVTSSL